MRDGDVPLPQIPHEIPRHIGEQAIIGAALDVHGIMRDRLKNPQGDERLLCKLVYQRGFDVVPRPGNVAKMRRRPDDKTVIAAFTRKGQARLRRELIRRDEQDSPHRQATCDLTDFKSIENIAERYRQRANLSF